LQIVIRGYCFGQNFKIILSQVVNSSLIQSQVWQGGKNYIQSSSAKTVIILYFLSIIIKKNFL
jgi:hypothetical protein